MDSEDEDKINQTQGEDVTDLITQSPKKLEKQKKQDIKNIPLKKLPKMFRKSYSAWALNKLILKKIYIPEDKAFIDSLFVQGLDKTNPKYLAIPADRLFSKREVSRCKSLAKAVKGNRGVVRVVPLFAVLIFLFLAAAFVITFKNPLAKKALVTVCEKAFKAKTDIDSVDLKIFGTSLTINHIQVGNRDSVMKNLFEAQKIEVKFSLYEALRGRFDAENLEASGLAFDTDRTYSCYIPGSERTGEEGFANSRFMQSLQTRSKEALDELYTEVTDVLGGDDVDEIVRNVQKQLQTPAMFTETFNFADGMITKWSAKPDELKNDVDEFAKTIQDLQTLQVSNTFDVDVLKSNLTKINNAITASQGLKGKAVNLVNDVALDVKGVQVQAERFTDAALSDIDFARDKLTSIKNIATNSQVIFTDALDSVGYDLMGKYYPYARNALSYAEQVKAYTAQIKPKKEKKTKPSRERMEGTTFWFTPEKPTFLIENSHVSGTGFSATLSEVTNDQNVRGLTTKMDVNFNVQDVVNQIDATLDIRRNTTAPLISVNYAGNGFAMKTDGTRVAQKSGVPSLDGKATIRLSGSGGNNQFSAGGSVDINPVALTSDGFENDMLTRYYQVALGAVTRLNMGLNLGYTDERGVWLDLDGNFADEFSASLFAVAQTIGQDAKLFALKKIEDEINNSQNEILNQVKDFMGIEGDIDLQNIRISDLQTILENKKKEVEAQIKKASADAMMEGVKQTFGEDDSEALDAASTLLQRWGF